MKKKADIKPIEFKGRMYQPTFDDTVQFVDDMESSGECNECHGKGKCLSVIHLLSALAMTHMDEARVKSGEDCMPRGSGQYLELAYETRRIICVAYHYGKYQERKGK